MAAGCKQNQGRAGIRKAPNPKDTSRGFSRKHFVMKLAVFYIEQGARRGA